MICPYCGSEMLSLTAGWYCPHCGITIDFNVFETEIDSTADNQSCRLVTTWQRIT